MLPHDTPFPAETAEQILEQARELWHTRPGDRREIARAGSLLAHAIRLSRVTPLGQWSYAQAWTEAEQAADVLEAMGVECGVLRLPR